MRQIQVTYAAMPKQAEAHGLTAKYRGFCGGWGNGKTSFGCVETFVSLHEYPNTNSIVSRKTRPELKATTWDMLVNGDPTSPDGWHGIPEQTIDYHNRSDLHIKFRNGSQIYGLPLDDPKKIENYNLGHFWIDQAEEVEEDIFLKFQGRLRQHHSPREGILTFNPNGHNWLWHRFIDEDRPEAWQRLYKCIEATTYDNPNLPADYFEQFEGLPEAWIQRFVLGSHEVFVGQIFTDWEPKIHVVPGFRIPPNWPRWLCIDPGIRHEGALSWAAQDFEGNVFYYREHLETGQDISWWATKIFELEMKDDWGGPNEQVTRRLIGREALIRAQTDGRTVLDVYHEHGVFPEIADRDPNARISKITEYLRPRSGHRQPWTGGEPSPRLYVFSDCSKLLEYLPQYRWRPQRTNYSEEDAPEKPRKKDDHNVDNLGHILLAIDGLPPLEDSSEVPATPGKLLDEHFVAALERAQAAQEEYWGSDTVLLPIGVRD
jgi:terminase large subunit-like protein